MNDFDRLWSSLPADMADRFMSKVAADPTSDCLLWSGDKDQDGYGRFQVGGAKRRSHRISCHYANGALVPGSSVLHSCDNPACVNPSHLRQGTHTDNMQDRTTRGRHPHALRTHCPRQHPLITGNLSLGHLKKGLRQCAACNDAHSAKGKAKRRGVIWSEQEFVSYADARYEARMDAFLK